MKQVFEATEINGMPMRNRLVRSATWEGLGSEDGGVTEPLVDIYRDLARGGVGLIISSYLFVRDDGRQHITQLGVHRDELLPGLTKLAEVVHREGGAIVGQIVHCGGQANRKACGGLQPVAPSAVESPGYPEKPEALSTTAIGEIVQSFAAAAKRLKAAGFDGVQLHGAHGYLLSQFLSPLRNQRTDTYGGCLENRCRFALEVYRAVRQAVGSQFPVMMKLNANDFLDGSTTEEDAGYLAMMLAREGLDAVEVSGGTPGSGKLGAARVGIRTTGDEAYFLKQAKAIRAAAPKLALMLVGGVRSLERIEAILTAGQADYFSLCRPLVREPELPKRWQSGDRSRAACISCSRCYLPARKGEGIRCIDAENE